MWICPVCKNEEEDEKAFCYRCGFDHTADCESLPTFGAIRTGRASIAGRQAQLAREKQAEAEKLARQKALSDEMRKQAEDRARKTAGAANTSGNSAGSYSAGIYTGVYAGRGVQSAKANASLFRQMLSGRALPKLISAIIILAAAAGYFYALTDAVLFGSIGVLAVAASLVLWLLGGFRMKAKKKLFTAQTVIAAVVGIAVADFDIMVLAFVLLAVWQFITFMADKKARGK